jgi:hypothetical protein
MIAALITSISICMLEKMFCNVEEKEEKTIGG